MAIGEDVHRVASVALEQIKAAESIDVLDRVRAQYLGRGDGRLTLLRKRVTEIADADNKRAYGQTVNELWSRVDEAITERRTQLANKEKLQRRAAETIDLTWPATPLQRGYLHPTTRCAREIYRIFTHLGYMAVTGPEIEYDLYNFTLVNMPPEHPSRDTQDTFYIDEFRLLRTHTTPVQIRAMTALGAPMKVIVPGKTYRRDNDPTHTTMFHQVEAMYIDEGVTVGDLKGTLEFFARSMFGQSRSIRLRPHHFAYTEPSLEVDVSCMVCGGSGCRTCRGSGWIEILGSGMIHPDVLRNGGIDPSRYSGFALGAGIERIAQLAWGIADSRLLYENDLRYLRQG